MNLPLKGHQLSRRAVQRRRGSVLVLSVFLMIGLLAFAALAIDLGLICVLRTEYQAAADSGATAGVGMLALGPSIARDTATKYSLTNAGGNFAPTNCEVSLGYWDVNERVFQNGTAPLNSVHVVLHNQSSSMFGRVLGQSLLNARAEATARVPPRDIMLVLDFSGSMNAEHKIESLKEAVTLFLSLIQPFRSYDRVGFVRYSTNGTVEIGMTYDLDQVGSTVTSQSATGWTNIGEGMQLAREQFEHKARPKALKLMVLMTDGLANRPANVNPKDYVLTEAQLACEEHIPIVAITLGKDADRNLMEEVADISHGTHFLVTGDVLSVEDELKEVFRRVAAWRPSQLVD